MRAKREKTGLFLCLTRKNVDLTSDSQFFARTTLKSDKANRSVVKNELNPSFTLLHVSGQDRNLEGSCHFYWLTL